MTLRKRILMIPLALMLTALMVGGPMAKEKSLDAGASLAKGDAATETVVIFKTTQGDIFIRFYSDIAPEHTKNFIEHSESGYYEGCTFHRVIPNFVIQGGDPNTKDEDPSNDGYGGYSYKGEGSNLPAEFSDEPHLRGTMSMARSQDPNSAGSQFFICHAKVPSLDGKYTVFGEVVDGIEVVDLIVNVPRDKRDRPKENQTITEVLVVEWTTEKVEASKKAMWEDDGATKKK